MIRRRRHEDSAEVVELRERYRVLLDEHDAILARYMDACAGVERLTRALKETTHTANLAIDTLNRLAGKPTNYANSAERAEVIQKPDQEPAKA